MKKLLGANWWTTLWGTITAAAAVIAIHPEVVGFLPPSWMPTVGGVALFIGFISGTTFSVGVKSKNVTGGTVQQTANGAVATPAHPSTSVQQTLTAPPAKA